MSGRKFIAWIGVAVAWLLLAGTALAQTHQAPWVEQGADGETRVHLWFFWAETCLHCQAVHPFVEAIARERPWVVLHSLEVSRDRENSRRFDAMAEAIGQRAEAVPTLMYCGMMEVGWDSDASSGARLLRQLDECRKRGGVPSSPSSNAGASPIELPLVGTVDPAALSLPLFTLVIASLDAFNPCAFFVLLFLLSLLAHQKDRRRMLTVSGVFILTSGLMYFAFMAAWLNVFQMLGALTWITLAAGLLAIGVGAINVKDFFAFEKGITLSIPESAKPHIYRRARAILQSGNGFAMLAATVFLAVAANFYELLCTAGFPMVYTRILTLHEPSVTARYAWLALYNVIYVVPLALIVLAFVGTLAAHKMTEREGRLLKLMSGVMMLELGLVLAFVPAWINNLAVTAGLVGIALLVTFVAARLTRTEALQ
jgi:thiol-disulfide isomerase/thioredoxin